MNTREAWRKIEELVRTLDALDGMIIRGYVNDHAKEKLTQAQHEIHSQLLTLISGFKLTEDENAIAIDEIPF